MIFRRDMQNLMVENEKYLRLAQPTKFTYLSLTQKYKKLGGLLREKGC